MERLSALQSVVPRLVRFVHYDGSADRQRTSARAGTALEWGPSAPTYPVPRRRSLPLPLTSTGEADNPVVTGSDVSDYGNVDYVADPFLVPDRTGSWHMFMEVYNEGRTPTGVIGHATSDDGLTWRYDRVVLQEAFHLSFPYVFRWEGRYYLLPEQGRLPGTATVRLYEAESFPHRWTPVADIVAPDHQTHDHVVFRYDDRWWVLIGDTDAGVVYAYHSDSLVAEEWIPHDANPVVTDRQTVVRPAGRPVVCDQHVLAFFQDCKRQYGDVVRAFVIDELTPTSYNDEELPDSPILRGYGLRGWNSGRMHHVDPWPTTTGWLCAVDGDIGIGRRLTGETWSIGIFDAGVDSD